MQSLSETVEQAEAVRKEIQPEQFSPENQERVIKLLQSIDYYLADINWKLLMTGV